MAWDVRFDCNAGTRGLIVVGKAVMAVLNFGIGLWQGFGSAVLWIREYLLERRWVFVGCDEVPIIAEL